ncbi:hypothetical protein Plhal304r1_c022g0078071 [Plasmopara halstedii]
MFWCKRKKLLINLHMQCLPSIVANVLNQTTHGCKILHSLSITNQDERIPCSYVISLTSQPNVNCTVVNTKHLKYPVGKLTWLQSSYAALHLRVAQARQCDGAAQIRDLTHISLGENCRAATAERYHESQCGKVNFH